MSTLTGWDRETQTKSPSGLTYRPGTSLPAHTLGPSPDGGKFLEFTIELGLGMELPSPNDPPTVPSKPPDLLGKKKSGPNYQVKQKTPPAEDTKDTEHMLFLCAKSRR